MTIDNRMREWATPISIGAFVLSATTGIMLFFNMQLGLVRPVHEWCSWLLVLGALFHTFVNRAVFKRYFSKPLGLSIITFFFLLICISVLAPDDLEKHHPFNRVSEALIESPLFEVALIANHKPEEVVSMLRSQGIQADSTVQTIRDIAEKNKKNPLRILDAIF